MAEIDVLDYTGGGDLFIHRISTVKTARLGIDTIIANVLVSCKMGSNR